MQIALSNRHRPITAPVHGIVDYVYGALFMAAPWLFGFSSEVGAQQLAVTLGAITILYSVFTEYPPGLIRVLPFRAHLWLDGLFTGAVLILPWVIPFSDRSRWTFEGFGVLALVVWLLTKRPNPEMPS